MNLYELAARCEWLSRIRAEHITLGIAARAGLVAEHVAVLASAGASRLGGCARGGLLLWGAQNPEKLMGS